MTVQDAGMHAISGYFRLSGPRSIAGTAPGGRSSALARWKNILLGCILAGLVPLSSPALADPWKNESGHGSRGSHDERRWSHNRDREEYRRWVEERRRERERERRWAEQHRRKEEQRRWVREQEQRRQQHWAEAQEYAPPVQVNPVPVPVPILPAPVLPAPVSPEAPRRVWQ
jgi:hypothetical protein